MPPCQMVSVCICGSVRGMQTVIRGFSFDLLRAMIFWSSVLFKCIN